MVNLRCAAAQTVQDSYSGSVRTLTPGHGRTTAQHWFSINRFADNAGMFSPSQDDVRRFFCAVHAKAQVGQTMEAIEMLASGWITEHPEYHGDLADAGTALLARYDGQDGRTNPFLHLSISEQCSIDQPRGIRQAVELLTHRRNSLHQAHHEAMDCLGQMIWESQRAGHAPDGEAYVACVQRHATGDA